MPFHGSNPGVPQLAQTWALWKFGALFDGNRVQDVSGNGRHLYVDGQVNVPAVSGAKDLAWRVGLGDSIFSRFPGTAEVWTSFQQSMTVEMVMRLPRLAQRSDPTTHVVLFSAGGRYDDQGLGLGGENVSMLTVAMNRATRDLVFFWDNQANVSAGSLGYVVPYNEWLHLAVVRNYVSTFNTTAVLFVNGVQIGAPVTKTAPLSTGRTGALMGCSVGSAHQRLDGMPSFQAVIDVDTVHVSTGVRTPAELLASYQNALSLGVPPDRRRRALALM